MVSNSFDLVRILHKQRQFSLSTFGPGSHLNGVLTHARKTLDNIEDNPTEIKHWINLILLAFDGVWRAGYEPESIAEAISETQEMNEASKRAD